MKNAIDQWFHLKRHFLKIPILDLVPKLTATKIQIIERGSRQNVPCTFLYRVNLGYYHCMNGAWAAVIETWKMWVIFYLAFLPYPKWYFGWLVWHARGSHGSHMCPDEKFSNPIFLAQLRAAQSWAPWHHVDENRNWQSAPLFISAAAWALAPVTFFC